MNPLHTPSLKAAFRCSFNDSKLVEKINGYQSTRSLGGAIAVICQTHRTEVSLPPWKHEVKLKIYRQQIQVCTGPGIQTRTGQLTTCIAADCALFRGFDACLLVPDYRYLRPTARGDRRYNSATVLPD